MEVNHEDSKNAFRFDVYVITEVLCRYCFEYSNVNISHYGC